MGSYLAGDREGTGVGRQIAITSARPEQSLLR